MKKRCPKCQREFGESILYCQFDGQPLTLNMVLDEKYRLEEKIGEGGMGQVYRATHLHIGTTVAIKLLNPEMISDQVTLERFRREARASAQLQHPNVVTVTDFGITKDSGVIYLVMEYLKGESLKSRLQRLHRLSLLDCADILNQVCSALHAAHTLGIIHRDLKPDNIFIIKDCNGNDQVKVLDFGIAKLKNIETSSLTQSGMILGTPSFMSPEQISDENIDPRSDIYSLGVILYQMITGKLPFVAPTSMALLVKHLGEPPKPISAICDDIPLSVEAVVMKALKKNRTERQQSVRELAQEFQQALSTTGIDPTLIAPTPEMALAGAASIALVNKIAPIRPIEYANGLVSPSIYEAKTVITPALFNNITDKAAQRRGKFVLRFLLLILALGITLSGTWWFFSNRSNQPKISQVATGPMILIPAGTFTMGDNNSSEEAEKPEHAVMVNAFYLDKYEVTNEEYQEFVKATNHALPSSWTGGKFPIQEAKYPVVNVSWSDANAYATWAGKRLPSEAEWEYAARGTDKRRYPWGNDYDATKLNAKEGNINSLLPVGSFVEGASPFGLLDMAGNAAEWTADDYQRYQGSKAKLKPGKIARGGSYYLDKSFAMTTSRVSVSPDMRYAFLGFRCAKDVMLSKGR